MAGRGASDVGGGVVFGAAYLLTGSLWVPIVLHVALDVTSGLTGAAALGEGSSASRAVSG